VRISAAAYDSRHPERSWVILRSPEHPRGHIYRQGMPLGDRTLVDILPRAIRLQSAGSSCLIGMFTERSREKIAREQVALDPPKAKRARSEKAARKRERARHTRAAPALSPDELAAGIRKIDDDTYRLDRKLVDNAFERATRIAGSTRLTPVRRRGKVIGMRLVSMREDGLLSRIGLQRGDILRNVNGYDVGNTDAMLRAYSRLADVERMTLAVQRGGRFLSLEYSIQ
jgi:hypothetical protein